MTTHRQIPTLGGGGGGAALPDPRGLLVALVLVPTSYPRNRFFEMYKTPEGKRVRRRAANLRAMLAELRDGATEIGVAPWGDGFELRYAMPELAAVRRVRVDRLELSLLGAVLRRGEAPPVVLEALTAAVGEHAILELSSLLVKLLDAPMRPGDA